MDSSNSTYKTVALHSYSEASIEMALAPGTGVNAMFVELEGDSANQTDDPIGGDSFLPVADVLQAEGGVIYNCA